MVSQNQPGDRPAAEPGQAQQGPAAADRLRLADLVTVYWRPGCMFCQRLRRGLQRAGLATTEVNIWQDAAAAATVRRLAGGHETVPTVVVGGTALVNPGVAEVLDALHSVAPGLVPVRHAGRRPAGAQALLVVQWIVIAGMIGASFAVDAAGHSGVSWLIDGVTVAVYVVFRFLRRQLRAMPGARAGEDR